MVIAACRVGGTHASPHQRQGEGVGSVTTTNTLSEYGEFQLLGVKITVVEKGVRRWVRRGWWFRLRPLCAVRVPPPSRHLSLKILIYKFIHNRLL